MKKSLLTMLLGALAIGSASAETYDFSYIDAPNNSLGIQAAETYDVAICLPGELFEGFRVKSISATVNASAGVSGYKEPSLWLSSDLTLSGKNFTPSIATYPVEMTSKGILSTDLPEDFTITADGVYVGYTLTVSKLNNATKFPMSFAECSDPNAMFCRTSKTIPSWSNLAVEMGCGAAISVVLESDNVAAHSVMLYSAPSAVYMEIDKPWTGTFGLASFAKEPVKSVDVEYAIEGKTFTQHFDLPEEVPAGLNKKFSVDVEIAPYDHKLNQNVTFTVTKVNGEANESKMAESTVPMAVIREIPAHQTLIEEYTGTWCGWCTRGYAALEYIAKHEPEFVVAAFHNGDPMTITDNYPVSPSGFPFVSLDRYYGGDPYDGTGSYDGILPIVEEVKALNAEVTPWGIEVSHEWDGQDKLIAKADVWNVIGFEEQDYYIAYLLVADGLSGKSSSWFQTNNYASYNPSTSQIPELNAFCKGGEYGKSKVGGLIFNDVVVSTNGIYGIEGSIPSSLQAEEKVSHTLEFDISKISQALIPDRNKLRVIAAVLDRNGYVVNCAKNEVNDCPGWVAVETVEAADSDAPAEYFNLNGMKVNQPEQGIFIRRQGSRTSKIVK